MKSTGIVYDMRRYTGEATPPLTVLEDDSRYGSDGDFQASGHPAWVKEGVLWALDFDSGTPDYVEITCPQLNFTSEDFSGIARIYLDDLPDISSLFMRGSINVDGWHWAIYTDGSIKAFLNQLGDYTALRSTASAVSTGAWYTIGFSRNGTSGKAFVNGIDKTGVVDTLTNSVTSTRTAKIGIFDDKSSYPFDGKMAFLRIFNYALSPEAHAAYHQELSQWG